MALLLSQNCLRSNLRTFNFIRISWGSMPSDPPSLAFVHIRHPKTKILATGLRIKLHLTCVNSNICQCHKILGTPGPQIHNYFGNPIIKLGTPTERTHVFRAATQLPSKYVVYSAAVKRFIRSFRAYCI